MKDNSDRIVTEVESVAEKKANLESNTMHKSLE